MPRTTPSGDLPEGVREGEIKGEFIHVKTGIVLVWVPPGTFRMGSDAAGVPDRDQPEDDEKPVHEVRLTRGLFMGKTEVTWGQYRAYCAASSAPVPSLPDYAVDDLHPVVNVSWADAQGFCAWAGLRLPTEAEWEWAARGTDGRRWPWGNEDPSPERLVDADHPIHGDKSAAHVGSCPAGASPWGAQDMAGNVWEWVQDGYDISNGHAFDTYPRTARIDPTGSGTYARRDRGGSWNSGPRDCRASNRGGEAPGERRGSLGFRAVLAPPPWPTSSPVQPAPGQDTPPAMSPPKEPLPDGVRAGPAGEFIHVKTGIALVWVPPGTFRMGCGDAAAAGTDQQPVHEVRLTRGFFVGKTEVTWGQYRAYCQATHVAAPSNVLSFGGRYEAGATDPVFGVSWDDAQGFCRWAGLRLPTEAEWEYAARGADGRTYPWGDEAPRGTPVRCNLGGERDGFPKTAPVGSFPAGASPAGALDMAGNVFEWVQDWHAAYPEGPQTDPVGPAQGEGRVFRGGSWDMDAKYCRSCWRVMNLPGTRSNTVGFRVVVSSP